MQDTTRRFTHSRKRSIWELEEEEDDEELTCTPYAASGVQDTPAKRFQNKHGEAIKRQQVKYNTQKLLNSLAFTHFYVTANFNNYNPRSSFIILCMVAEQNHLYQALWQVALLYSTPRSYPPNKKNSRILPSLYSVAPTLQALAVTTGYISPNAMADQSLLRILPLVTTAGMEVSIVEDFERFQRDIGGPEGCFAVIDVNGHCVWNSAEFLNGYAFMTGGDSNLLSLQASLIEVLRGSNKDVVMSEG